MNTFLFTPIRPSSFRSNTPPQVYQQEQGTPALGKVFTLKKKPEQDQKLTFGNEILTALKNRTFRP